MAVSVKVEDLNNEAFLRGVETGQAVERELILKALHWYVGVGDPALIKGVDRAITMIEARA